MNDPPSSSGTYDAPDDVRDTIVDADLATNALRVEELSRLHILRRVALESVLGLLEPCPIRLLKIGEALFHTGQSNQTMFMVLSGKLSVHLDTPENEPVAFLEAGETVGEISVLDDSPVSAFVLAAEPTRLLAVDEETFWRLVTASHEFAKNLLLLLAQRMRANNSKISEGTRLKKQFERDAMVDALTSVHNRRWLEEKLPRMVQRHRFSGLPLSIAMLDVDHFKRFNDTYGHRAGDQVLALVGKVLSTCLRPTDLSARYGGEEFVVILPDSDLDAARHVAERLRVAISSAPAEMVDGRVLPAVTVSLGIAQLDKAEDAATFLARADAGLYRAKKNGRDRVEA